MLPRGPGHSDPEGEATRKSLRDMNYNIGMVRTIKVYELSLHANSLEDAEKQVEEMCVRLLANPIKDNYDFKIVEEK